jgi:hypothetical protein
MLVGAAKEPSIIWADKDRSVEVSSERVSKKHFIFLIFLFEK